MPSRILTVREHILGANHETAALIRKNLTDHHIRMLNLLSAPGSGKTCLILQTLRRLGCRYRIAVIAADAAALSAADKALRQDTVVISIPTGGACHLDASMVRKALDSLDLNRIDLIFIENLGNLVCTAEFDLGAHIHIVLLSIPEGDDQARKYPSAFMQADAVLLSKIDVLPYFDFNPDKVSETLGGLNPAAKIFPLSAKSGEGMDSWLAWLESAVQQTQ